MSMLYPLNYAIFAAFLTLFTLETGIALALLLFYEKLKDTVLGYLIPVWEITGTFAVFYVVNFIASFPTLITLVGRVYIAPLLVAVLFFIGRNAFIAYAEYMRVQSQRRYLTAYAVATLAVAYIVVAVLSSGISGIGVNVHGMQAHLGAMMLNPLNVLMFAGIALIAAFMMETFFVRRVGWPVLALGPMGVAAVTVAVAVYDAHALAGALGAGAWLLAAVVALLAASIALKARDSGYARYIALVWLFVSINAFGAFQYPSLFGGSVDIGSYLNAGAVGSAATAVTLVGGLFLTMAMVFFVYIVYIKKLSEGKKEGGY